MKLMIRTVLGEVLKDFRIMHDISLKEMANKCGLESVELSQMEFGKKPFDMEALRDYINDVVCEKCRHNWLAICEAKPEEFECPNCGHWTEG